MSRIIKRLFLLLCLFSLCRFLFFIFNYSYFRDIGFPEFIKLFFFGIKFDVSAILMLNAPVLVLELLPFPFRSGHLYKKLTRSLFILINSIGLLSNCIDLVYFRFILKRSTFDIFSYFSLGKDVQNMLPQYLKDYWYVALLWIGLIILLVFLLRKIEKKEKEDLSGRTSFSARYFFMHTFILIVSIALCIFLYRGGLQLKPISIISAGKYTSVKNIPLVINTPFSILKTMDLEQISEKKYFSETELKNLFNPVHEGNKTGFRKMNVVIIILESFSKEYCGYFNGGAFTCTPFLDSLAGQSLSFTNAYANGKRSIEALPAIVAGIPTLMNEPYLTSIYGSNQISSIASVLAEKGYGTSFYHGGANGTMGFDAFSRLAGFDKYYGRSEYNNEKDFDGHWGIWDEEFFQYFARKLEETKQPFFSTLFSLSSHHPFMVPEKHHGKFKEGSLPVHKSIRYTDYSLKQFFKTAASMPWYNNTLFLITGDHTGPAGSPFYGNQVGMYQVPVIFYSPSKDSKLKGIKETPMSHCDLMPTLLHYLAYEKPVFSFGNDAMDSTIKHFNVNFSNNIYQFIEDKYLLQFDGETSIGFFDITRDSLLSRNLISDTNSLVKEKEQKLKAIIQTYNNSLINNKMKP